MREATEWHRLVFNGRLAEIAAQYLRKGSQIYVEGQLRTRKYTDKDGVEKYATDIRVDQMQMLGSRQGQGGPSGGDDDGGYSQGGSQGGGYSRPPAAGPARPLPRRARHRPSRPQGSTTWTTTFRFLYSRELLQGKVATGRAPR